MTSETKEIYPEVTSFTSPVSTYTQSSSTAPSQGGVYNKSAEAQRQPTVDSYQHTGVTIDRMASPPVQHNFQQPQPQNNYHMQHQGSFQSQPGQNQPQMQHINSPGSVPQQQQFQTGQQQQYMTAYPLASLASSSAPVDCPACGKRAMTNTHFETGNTANAWALGVCLLTCLGCFVYLFNGVKDVVHKCSQCGTELAVWHRSGRTDVKRH